MMKFKKIPLWLLIVRKKRWKLHFVDLWWWADRNILMINILKESLSEDNIIDFPPVVINTGDRPMNKMFKLNVFSFTTANWYYDRIIPDWTYDSRMECKIPKFKKITKDIIEAWKFQADINKIWRIWNFRTSPSRLKLKDLWDRYPQHLDIRDSNTSKYMSLPDLVKTYRYLIDVEWNGFSWRLKYLFFSGRPVFVQDRIRNEYALMWAIPYRDYIPVKNDFSDLIEKIEKYFDTELLQEIWKNWQKFAVENLSKRKAYEYIRNEFINLKKEKNNKLKITILVFLRRIVELAKFLIIRIFKILWIKK